MRPEHELVRQWLNRARLDLRSAALALTARPPITEDACFHCQQAVEKALKAFLVYHGVEFEKLHLIGYLLDLCAGQDSAFEQLRTSAVPLTSYATRFRYPHPDAPPTSEQVRHDLDVAKRVCGFVLDRLPRQVHPSDEQP